MRGSVLGAALVVVLALAAPAGASAARAPLVVKVRAPAVVTVGALWRAQVTVARGGRRVAGLPVRVRVRLGGSVRTVRAAHAGRGVYRATVRLSSAGRWAYAVLVSGKARARGSVVARAPSSPPPGPPPPPPPAWCTSHPVPAPRAGFQEWNVVNGPQVHPHDIWPAGDGTVWYTGQFKGTLGRLVSATGAFCEVPLGAGSSPHGVIAGPDGDGWVTDQGRNSIIRVDRLTEIVTEYPVPPPFNVSPHTAAWDEAGILWFTGANGFVGRLDPSLPPAQAVQVWPAPLGGGPYGIDTTPAGDVWFVSLRADGYLGRIDKATGQVQQVAIPSPGVGPRRVWSDSQGRLWVTLWSSGHLGRYDPAGPAWKLWRVPPEVNDSPYAVYVDDADVVWITAFASNALVRFTPATETFTTFPFPAGGAAVRQIVGDESGIWGAASGLDGLLRFNAP